MFRAFGVLLSSLFLLAVLQLEGVRALFRLEAKDCVDVDPNCALMLPLGICSDPTAQKQCLKTCGLCGTTATTNVPCVDESQNCYSWAANGFCTSPSYTEEEKRKYCAKTCGLCGSSCFDTSNFCATWAHNGFCDNPDYSQSQKQQYCAKTCGLC